MSKSKDQAQAPRMPQKLYERELYRLQAELVTMQEWIKAEGKRLVVIGPRENIFHHGERVEDQFNNWKACLAAIKRGEIA